MSFSLKSLFRPDATVVAAHDLYGAIVAQARGEVFFSELGVPDTPAGRFDMVALHGFLVMDRLSREVEAVELSQALVNVMFADLDHNLREMGVGDLSVGKKVQGLARQFYGLSAAYGEGLGAGGDSLAAALRRNLYCDSDPRPAQVAAMAAYVRGAAERLAGQTLAAIAGGRPEFGDPVSGEPPS